MGSISEEAFLSIHQIDLVPTISLLLGLPIPFANIGSLVPSLLPLRTSRSTAAPTAQIATALALNAAQVWEYFTTYALPLQAMTELRALLDSAIAKHKSASLQPASKGSEDSMDYRQACALYKVFLTEATKLGKRLWTTFDVAGMVYGIMIILFSLLVDASHLFSTDLKARSLKSLSIFPWFSLTETIVASIVMVFQCALLTFSNSYINSERNIIMFSLSILCIVLVSHRGLLYYSYTRMRQLILINGKDKVQSVGTDLHNICWMLVLVPCCSRLSELFVTGHGMDPSIPKHAAHNPVYFILSLAVLSILRMRSRLWDAQVTKVLPLHDLCDLSALVALALSWLEKRSSDTSRNGYVMCRITIALSLLSLLIAFCRMVSSAKNSSYSCTIFSYLTLLMVVTGPSAAPTAILYLIQIWSLSCITKVTGPGEVSYN
jgi:phosphatidylinositol glycan class O